MSAILWFGGPIMVGFVCGYFLSLPVNAVLTLAAAGMGSYLLWSTRNAEIGAFVGIIAAIQAGIFTAALWLTIALVHGALYAPNLSWLLRSAS